MKFALIGHPVAGSLSPRLFTAAYDGRYPYELVDRERFEDAWDIFLKEYHGINVTAPFKQDAYARVEHMSQEARRSGAVNLVVKRADGLYATNTDIDGVVSALQETGRTFTQALVVGTGGAARAAVVGAQKLGCRVCVTGRSADKVQAFVDAFGCESVPFGELSALRPQLVIYTLPGRVPVPPGLNFAESVVLEAEYRTPVLQALPCKEYIHGRRWLLGQAIAGYQIFTGEKPDMENLINAI
jgi:Shikimate 5-dehydrogenase